MFVLFLLFSLLQKYAYLREGEYHVMAMIKSWQELAGVGWQELAGVGWQELAGVGWQELAGVGWQELAGVGRSWLELVDSVSE